MNIPENKKVALIAQAKGLHPSQVMYFLQAIRERKGR